jgi:hypothetical protein
MEVEVLASEEGRVERKRVAQRDDLAHVLDKNRAAISMARRVEWDELCDRGGGGGGGELVRWATSMDNDNDDEAREIKRQTGIRLLGGQSTLSIG